MIFNWNDNDTKYVIKKFIILLCGLIALTILTTWKAKAQTISFTKPTRVRNYLLNEPSNPGAGGSWTNNYADNITQSVLIEDAGEYSQLSWEVLSFNQEGRLSETNVFYNFPSVIDTQMILEFDYTYQSTLNGDVPNVLIDNVGVLYNDMTNTQCGIVGWTGSERIVHKWDVINKIKCIVDKPIAYIFIQYREAPYNVNQEDKQYIGTNANIRTPVSNEELEQTQQQINDGIQNMHDLVSNAYTTTADSSFLNNFLNNHIFDDDTGLQSIITLPLHMVSNLSNTCQPINLTIPYINANVILPCMSTLYQTHFNGIYTLISVVINGFFIYRILLKIYQLVHDAKDPAQDKLEVVDL